MSEQQHTPEPWPPAPCHESHGIVSQPRSMPLAIADYERARICVNYCAGVPDWQLSGTTLAFAIRGDDLRIRAMQQTADIAKQYRDQCNELAAALSAYDEAFCDFKPESKTSRAAMRQVVIQARAAIKNFEGA